eukprot:TRINITY_DN26190_c0_g1_i1.p1 TRINITY_DN26190_c0_g1~~TRINITY_DN26190_c0_g1_i1.p1  ORF type:complete len:387 (-),score=39.70 TRINITY_DN26190_c0_g1_i1:246-1406(-)
MIPLTASASYADPSMRTMNDLSQGGYSPYGGGYTPQAQAGGGDFGFGMNQMSMPTQQLGSYMSNFAQPVTQPMGHYHSPYGYRSPPSTQNLNKQNCQEECAEEGCLEEEKFGSESRPPSNDYTCMGFDLKPILPIALSVSTVIGAICMLLVQIPMLSRIADLSEVYLSAAFATLYGVTLGCMTYCAFADPGQVRKSRGMNGDADQMIPRRGHKCWQYSRPVRRYDHYCKWLQNVIGLLNHREFVAMVMGLALISVLGMAIDAWLAILIAKKGKGFLDVEIIVLSHLGYSCILLFISGPIMKIHWGLVSRNETAQEWKKSDFYVAVSKKNGMEVSVHELDDEEFNELFDLDAFRYDQSRNIWDQGCLRNWGLFWCHPRWPAGELGEF